MMQGVKERACELLLRPCSHTAVWCGLEGGDRRRACEPECPKEIRVKSEELRVKSEWEFVEKYSHYKLFIV